MSPVSTNLAPSSVTRTSPSDALVGAALVASSILSVILMAHHPSVSAHDTSAALAGVARTAQLAKIVHGGLIALMAVQAFAFADLSTRLGWGKRVVYAAAIAYGSGFLAMIGAALISGFVVDSVVLHYAPRDESSLVALRCVLAACTAANRSLASFAAVAMSLAILLWSWPLRHRGRVGRALAALGLTVGVVPGAAILAGALRLEVAGMTAFVVVQTAWNVAVGLAIARGRIRGNVAGEDGAAATFALDCDGR